MKKFLVIFLSFILSISLIACGNDAKEDMVNDAVEELKSAWEDIYDDSRVETDGYFEIKNTRIIEIKENNIEEFKNVDYIIEFVLYTDYFASAPYYQITGINDTVVVFKDGSMEVQNNLINIYKANHYNNDFSDFIKSIDDYSDKYNCVEKLK